MANTNKTPKWSDEQVAVLATYEEGNNSEVVADFMERLDRNKRQVVGKLVSMGVYVAEEKPKSTRKDEGPTKKEILRSIADTGFDTTGFDNATKDALNRLLDRVS